MKKGAHQHPKIRKLARKLDIERTHAVGVLDTIFACCADYCRDGRLGRVDIEDIADWIDWEVERTQKLIDAMLEVGFLEPSSEEHCPFIIHDWYEHRPQWVAALEARSGERGPGKATGSAPSPALPKPTEPETQSYDSVHELGTATESHHSVRRHSPRTSPHPIPSQPNPSHGAGAAREAPPPPCRGDLDPGGEAARVARGLAEIPPWLPQKHHGSWLSPSQIHRLVESGLGVTQAMAVLERARRRVKTIDNPVGFILVELKACAGLSPSEADANEAESYRVYHEKRLRVAANQVVRA